MNDRGSVIIIPNENIIEDNYFEKVIVMNHLEGFQEFSDKYNLGYQFSNGDYQEAPIKIAKDGHLIIKTIKDMGVAIFYIPQVITKRQLEWLNDNIGNYMYIQKTDGFAINGENEEIDRVHGYYNLTNVLRERSKLYIEKEGERNVR